MTTKNSLKENQQLNSNINILTESPTSEKIKLNQLAQYTRSSFTIELTGIPCQRGGGVIDLTGKVVEAANITGYDPNQIDIAHRTSSQPIAPIIIMFERKRDRNNFYQQKMKLKNIKSSTIVNQSARGEQDEATVQDIYINESLTQENHKLLKEAKTEANKLKYQYLGYTVNGEIRVRKSANEDHMSILWKSNLDKTT